jgi:hypothetical protein
MYRVEWRTQKLHKITENHTQIIHYSFYGTLGVYLWVDSMGKIMGETGSLGPLMIDAPGAGTDLQYGNKFNNINANVTCWSFCC